MSPSGEHDALDARLASRGEHRPVESWWRRAAAPPSTAHRAGSGHGVPSRSGAGDVTAYNTSASVNSTVSSRSSRS